MSEATQPLTTVPRDFLGPPGDFNPTLLMFFLAVATVVCSALGYWCWHWPGWCVFLMNVAALHMAGTVIHDASHNVAHRDRLVNAALGHGSALLLGFSFPVFTRVHMQHHAHVNDPENDPDHFVSTGGPLWLIAARFFYHEIFFFKRKLWRKYELLEWFLGRLAVGLIVFLAVQYGFLGYIFNFWFSPALVVGLALGLFFDYLPHRPFKERDRWKNARVYPSPVLNWLIMGQNYHLIHHLWPSVPWYNYERAYWATQPLLDSKGCHQSLGLLKLKDFLGFVYDIFLGIRFHHKAPIDLIQPLFQRQPSAELAVAVDAVPKDAVPEDGVLKDAVGSEVLKDAVGSAVPGASVIKADGAIADAIEPEVVTADR